MPPAPSYRSLQPEKIVETIAILVRRIDERFPGSGLSNVAREVQQIAKEAVVRAEAIRRPNIPLRIGMGVLAAAIVALLVMLILRLRFSDELLQLEHFVQAVDSSLASLVVIGAVMVFLFTLELRRKRNRALEAVHELRALAHIVDMHQLTKDPERVTGRGGSTDSSPKRSMTPFELGRYLDYCSELLSIISKIGALYVQNFTDTVALEAVDQLTNLTNGLARNVWQKIMILEQMVGPTTSADANRTPATTDPAV